MTDRPSSSAIVRLVAAREASTRLRDKNFVIGSIVMVVLLLGILGFQVAANSGADEGRIGLVGETGALESSLRSQAEVLGVNLGKLLGLGLLGFGQMELISALGVTGALAFDLVDVPGALIGTVVTVVCWFVVGYAFYASVFAAAASLVSRQEDLGSVIAPTSMLLVVSFIIAIQAASAPAGTLATVTSLVPGLSPMVMPVRMAAGEAAVWEIAVAALLMLVAIAVVVRLGGRIYAGALLRTTGKVRLREALRADTA